MKDGLNNTTVITYNSAGLKTQMSDPDMGTWQYRYDANGNLIKQRDARNQAICFYYDALNRLVGKKYYSGVSDLDSLTCGTGYDVSYYYDGYAPIYGQFGRGRRTSMSDGFGSTSWKYDDRGRIWEEQKTISGTGGGTFVTQWSYDAMDRVVWMKYPGGNGGQVGEQVNFGYNPQALLNTVIGSATYVGGTTYNARGQVTERRLGSTSGVLRQLYTYTAAENFRLPALQSGTSPNYNNRQNITYTYDDVGNVRIITDTAAYGGSQTQNFTYDHLDRVVTAQASGGSVGTYGPESYTYNAIGNLLSKTGVGGSGNYLYDAPVSGCSAGTPATKPHAVRQAGSYTFTYDCNGNMVQRNVGSSYSLSYDAENRLTGVSGEASASFVYDGDGKRVKATFGSSTTAYVGDYFEWTGSTSTMVKYYYANGQRVAMRVGTSTVYYLLTDHLGSTAITATSSGSRTAELRYKAWGETRYTYGTTPTTYKFTGQRFDDSTGLYFYQSRYYDAALGRFVQADTLVPEPGNPQALNRYAYVLNNPLKYTDLDGHCPFGVFGCLYISYEMGNFAGQLYTWRDPSRALAASSESSIVLQPLIIEASKLMTARYERDIQQAATGQGVPSDILGAAIRLQALGSLMDPFVANTGGAKLTGQELQDVSVGVGQITLGEAQKFRDLGLIDFDPTLQNIRDPQRSIQLMGAKLKTVDMRILELGKDRSPISEADRRQLLMIGQNEGPRIVDLYFKYGGNWELIFQENPWARFHLEAMQRRLAE